MARPNFKNIPFQRSEKTLSLSRDVLCEAPEGIEIKSTYNTEDIAGANHLGSVAGIPPYLRGPYS